MQKSNIPKLTPRNVQHWYTQGAGKKEAASVLSEYLQLFSKYYNQYGEKTAVLMQVGGFYEIYGIDNGEDKVGNPVELSRILNITLTRRNKKVTHNDWNNPLMLGFPCLALKKYIDVLLEENFTIVVVDQIKTSLSVKRIVRDIISPSTYLDINNDTSFLVLVHVDKLKSGIHIGISAINILTGNSIVHECYSENNDISLSIDETVSFLKQYRPKEIVISGSQTEDFASSLDIGKDSGVLCHYKGVSKAARNVGYQNAILGNFFENKTMLDNIEYLDLERKPYALLSYVLLIEFVYCHNPMLLRKIYPPEIFVPSDHLVLATNTVDQLNVVPPGRKHKYSAKHTLVGVLNKCSTSMGKRLLTTRLLAPVFDTTKLEQLYQQVEDFGVVTHGVGTGNGKSNRDYLQEVEQLLSNIVDIERLQRRMSIGVMVPSELASLYTSYIVTIELNDLLKNKLLQLHTAPLDCCLSSVTLNAESSALLESFVDTCGKIFNIDNLSTCDLDNYMNYPIFNKGVFEDVDTLHDTICEEMDKITNTAHYLSSFCQGSKYNELTCKIDYTQYGGYCIVTSNTKAKKILNSLPNTKDFSFKHSKAATKITSYEIDEANSKISTFRERIKKLVMKRYKQAINFILSSYNHVFSAVTKFVSEVDVIKSNYKVSCMYRYCRPTIISKNSKNSFIDAQSLRHPVIERIDTGLEYVSNDVSIGTEYNGVILYSMNACGKTSLLKACGLSIIMAQAGCYVPASSYKFYPFRCIMTRILSEDNIMKGQSSFVAEMSELRSVLKRASNRQTLVLADEITHGTEHTSGSSIFISSVETLASRKVNFMFTTHLHNVYPFVKDIPNVRVFHLSVLFGNTLRDNKTIIFERKLKNGPGNSIYGLEVCEFLNMDTNFLARAFQLRNMITSDKTDTTATIKMSKYNKNKIVQHCEICNYSPKILTDMPLDVHHIKQKCMADCNGMIDGVYKNAKSNLVTLCKQCHVKVHRGEITVFGYKDISTGKKLSYQHT